MCICVVAYKRCSSFPLLLLTNRDEFYDRAALPLHQWDCESKIIAGKDLQQGGTWLGQNKYQQWICITNHHTSEPIKNARSRGLILTDYLEKQQTAKQFCETLLQQADHYNPFNLLIGDDTELYYFTSAEKRFIQLTPGIYCLSNAGLDTPWPKVVRLTKKFSELLTQPYNDDQLWSMLQDITLADDDLPSRGISQEVERTLSAIFIKAEHYGTRSSYILTKDNAGALNLQEKLHTIESAYE